MSENAPILKNSLLKLAILDVTNTFSFVKKDPTARNFPSRPGFFSPERPDFCFYYYYFNTVVAASPFTPICALDRLVIGRQSVARVA